MLAYITQFYIEMNLYYTLLRTYQLINSDSKALEHSLFRDTKYQIIVNVLKDKPKFFLIKIIVKRSFRTRVVILFIQEIIDLGLLDFNATPRNESRIGTIKKAIRKLKLKQYLEIVDTIQKKAFIVEAQAREPAVDAKAKAKDNEVV